jgi:hypothetical protein
MNKQVSKKTAARRLSKMIEQFPADEYQKELYKKFPSTHYLSNPTNVMHTLAWCTFFRKNLHRFVQDYLEIPIYPYQQLSLYYMGVSNSICIVAARNDAKSFLIALYACCRAILYPGSKVVIGSATRGQSKLIITEKIQGELMEKSAVLRAEIEYVKTNGQDVVVKFRSGSTIKVFTANDNARGIRSNVAIREEFRQIKKNIEDNVISPFQMVRQPGYIQLPQYKDDPVLAKILQEDPVDIYISSSWQDPTHWMWTIVDMNYELMLKHGKGMLLAFDESICLKHGFKTRQQLIKEKKKQDPTSWKVEFLNLRIKESDSAYFTYSMLMNRQISKQVFYPRNNLDVQINKKNRYAIPKRDNEVRIIAGDIAFVAGSQNDNSVYSCIRAIPETMTYGDKQMEQGYRRQFPYIESNQIGDTTKQAIRIRQLYEDFNADYIVIDARNGGLQILYSLQKVLYDEDRSVEYAPLKCMNNDEYGRLCQDPDAKPCIYAINGTQNLNSDIAMNFRKNLVEGKIDFLVNFETAKEEILSKNKEYRQAIEVDDVFDFERPFLETQALVSECAELQYEKLTTGGIRIKERGNNRKDRYSSCSYGSYFIDQLELDMATTDEEYGYATFVN